MNLFQHTRILKVIKILLLLPLVSIALNSPSGFTYGICIYLFLILLLDFIMIDKAKSDYRNLYYSAYHDSLTGIPNRLSVDLFVAENASLETLSVIMADLDGLKAANDTFGHHVGDILIRDFARMFSEAAAPYGLAARNGGDEFLAIFSGDGNGAKAREYCSKLQSDIDAYNKISPYRLSYSIGIGCGQEAPYDSIQQLISAADKRMYHDKAKKKSRTVSGNDSADMKDNNRIQIDRKEGFGDVQSQKKTTEGF